MDLGETGTELIRSIENSYKNIRLVENILNCCNSQTAYLQVV